MYERLDSAPCYECPDRVPPTRESNGCRTTCEKWKKYEAFKLEAAEQRKGEDAEWKGYYASKKIKTLHKVQSRQIQRRNNGRGHN